MTFFPPMGAAEFTTSPPKKRRRPRARAKRGHRALDLLRAPEDPRSGSDVDMPIDSLLPSCRQAHSSHHPFI